MRVEFSILYSSRMTRTTNLYSTLLFTLSAVSSLVFVNCFNFDRELQNFDQSLSSLDEQSNNQGNGRTSKFFPLFSIVRISNQLCVPESVDSAGTCFTNSQCRTAGGVASGVCANGFGVCCVVTATCESVVQQNNTNFRNRDFPSGFNPSGLEVCNVRVQKPSSNVCQLRLDFTNMQLAGADTMTGQCMADRLSINGVSGTPPVNLCGELTGQHMYLDYGSSDRITLSVITDGGAVTSTRQWNVKLSYIECNSISRAPDGCLQYYTSATGEVRMLGYPMAPHLADLDYTVCVRSEDGAGSIVWSPCQGEPADQSFLMTGMAASPPPGMPGPMCTGDYVLIMTDDPANPPTIVDDRYCGNGFATDMPPHLVRSIAKPFIMRVRTDNEEGTDVGNTGFCLAYRQEPPRPQAG